MQIYAYKWFYHLFTLRPKAMASITFEPLHLSVKRSIDNIDPRE